MGRKIAVFFDENYKTSFSSEEGGASSPTPRLRQIVPNTDSAKIYNETRIEAKTTIISISGFILERICYVLIKDKQKGDELLVIEIGEDFFSVQAKDKNGNLVARTIVWEVDAKQTLQNAIEKTLLELSGDINTPYEIIDEDDIPTDAASVAFRNCWVINSDKKIHVDMEKARELHLWRLLRLRKKHLSLLDIDINKAQDNKDSSLEEELVRKRQQLRGMPQSFDLTEYNTPEELRHAKPEYLDGNIEAISNIVPIPRNDQ